MSRAGLVVGILMFILVAYLTDKSLRMIIELARFHPKLRHFGVLTFEDLARIPFGRFGAGWILAVMFIVAYGAMVAYLLIIKHNLPAVRCRVRMRRRTTTRSLLSHVSRY